MKLHNRFYQKRRINIFTNSIIIKFMKRTNSYLRIVTLIALFSGFALSAIAKNEVKQLICEYKTNPLGIDILKPRLSWQVVSADKDVMQTAYEVRVADSPSKLNSNKLIWSTGKVNESQSVDVVYLSLIHISEPTRLGMISYAV